MGPRKKPSAAKEIGEMARVLLIWKRSTVPGMLPRYIGIVVLLYKIKSANVPEKPEFENVCTLRSQLELGQGQREASYVSTSFEDCVNHSAATSPWLPKVNK